MKSLKFYIGKAFVITALAVLPSLCAPTAHAAFVHPGIYHTQADLDVIKTHQNEEPWKSALAALKADSHASLTYTMQGPKTTIQRAKSTEGGNINLVPFENDMTAAYEQALLWYITDNQTYANKSIQILNAWSNTLTAINGGDNILEAGGVGCQICAAAEILAYTNSGWSSTDINKCRAMMTNVFYPVIQNFADANWGTCCIETMMAIGVFCNDQAKFDRAWSQFQTSSCPNDDSVTQYIVPSGQNGETGRDQVHALMGYRQLAGAAEIAYDQGKDSWGVGGNRLLAGYEYWCKYNLGNSVPYDSTVHRCTMGPWSAISSANRGITTAYSSFVNLVIRAYARKGLAAPYTSQMADAVGLNSSLGWGNLPSMDVLCYSMPPLADGTYAILNRNSSKGLDVSKSFTADGSEVNQYTYHGGNNQRWIVTNVGSGQYSIIGVGSHKALEVPSSSINVDISTFTSGANQLWTITPTTGGYYTITSVNSGQVLDVTGASLAESANVDVATGDGAVNKQWMFATP